LAQADSPPKLDEYERLLREHVERWPQSPTTGQAWNWLGRLAESRGQWPAAVEAFARVSEDDPQFAEAVEGLGRSYEGWLDELHEQGQNGERLANDALARFERVIGSSAKKPTPQSRAATLAAAWIWLTEIPTGAMPAERLLRQGLRDNAAPEHWKSSARRLLVPALVLQGKAREAEQAAAQLPRANAADLLALAGVLSQVRNRADPAAGEKLAEIELAVQDDLLGKRRELDAATLRAVTRDRAFALSAVGRRREALDAMQTLAADNPRDGQTAEALARLLASGAGADLPAAVEKWRDVAAHSRPGTPRWFRANYELASSQLRAGQGPAARATIDAVARRFPDFGGAGTKQQFERLKAEIERAPGAASE